MGRFWHEFWPQVIAVSFVVGVAGNLVASAILGVPAVTHLHRQAARHHKERMDQAERHHRRTLTALGVDDPDDQPGCPACGGTGRAAGTPAT